MKNLLAEKFDAVIDFMFYSTAEFQERYQLFLDSTPSTSSSVLLEYMLSLMFPSQGSSPRLLDICTDQTYLDTNEYALSKARSEDLLRATEKRTSGLYVLLLHTVPTGCSLVYLKRKTGFTGPCMAGASSFLKTLLPNTQP